VCVYHLVFLTFPLGMIYTYKQFFIKKYKAYIFVFLSCISVTVIHLTDSCGFVDIQQC